MINRLTFVGKSDYNLIYRYRLNENLISGSTSFTINDSNPNGPVNNPVDHTKTITLSNSTGQVSQHRIITTYKLMLRNNPTSQKNVRMITVNNEKKMIALVAKFIKQLKLLGELGEIQSKKDKAGGLLVLESEKRSKLKNVSVIVMNMLGYQKLAT